MTYGSLGIKFAKINIHREGEIWEDSSLWQRSQRENGIFRIFNMEKQYSMEDENSKLQFPAESIIKLRSVRLDTFLIPLHLIKYSFTSPFCQHHYESSTAFDFGKYKS